jgi:cobalamin biosynthesis protein CobD/CbiB
MAGAGRSNSPAVRAIGATVALIAVVGYLIFGWSFNGSANTIPTAIGLIVAVSAVGWTLYSRLYSDQGPQ